MTTSVFFQTFALQFRKILAYRADFWLTFLMSVGGNLVISYFLWCAIFAVRGESALGGFSFNGLILYYLMVPLVDRMVRGPEISFISQDIYDGGLSRYLLYPMSFFRYKFSTFFAESCVAAVQFSVAVTVFLGFFGVPADIQVSVLSFVLGFALVVAAIVMYFTMAAILECVAFWADNSWSVIFSLRLCVYFFGGGLFPLTFFPKSLQTVLPWTPFPYLISAPVRAFLGRLSLFEAMQGVGIMLIWFFVFMGILRTVWTRGLKTYTGVGI